MKNRTIYRICGGIVFLVVVGVLVFEHQAEVNRSRSPERLKPGQSAEGNAPQIHDESQTDGAISSPHRDSTQQANSPSDNGHSTQQHTRPDGGPPITKSSRRGAIDTPDGRKSVIDPLASWSEVPAWPEGPKLYAEVETSNKRYVNLRPNDMGLMPTLHVQPAEPLQVTLQCPEASVGESIYIELPNGGNFPDQSAIGQVVKVSENRTVKFSMQADDTRGHCTIHLRQAGHTRTIPLWVGEPAALASGDENL
jgi:hypothetical protein